MLVLPGRVGDFPIRAMNSASTGPFFREISPSCFRQTDGDSGDIWGVQGSGCQRTFRDFLN